MLKNKSLFLILSTLFILVFSSVAVANHKIFKYSKINIEDRALVSIEYLTETEFPSFIEIIKTELDVEIKDKDFEETLKINIEYLDYIKNSILKYEELLIFNDISNEKLISIILSIESLINETSAILEDIAIIETKENTNIYLDDFENMLEINKQISESIKDYKSEINK